ncbi:MAG: hypothetical protein ABEH88_07905 [Halobacteriales archaeon]
MTAPDERRSSGAPLLSRDATVDGGTAAVLIAAAAALLIGVASGPLLGMAAGVAGAVAVIVGMVRVADADAISRGIGSVALVVGAMFFIGAVTLPDGDAGLFLVVCGALGVLAVAAEALPRKRLPSLRPALYSLVGSAGVLLVASVGLLLIAPLLENVRLAATGGLSIRGGQFGGVLPSLVILQVLIVVLSLTIDRAKGVLTRWIPEGRTDGFSALDRLGVEPGEIPRELWAFLGVQVVLIFLLPGVITVTLRETAPGEALYVLLTGGVLHLPLIALIVLFAGVVASEALRNLVIRVAGYHPPTVIGLLGGGLVVTAGVFAAAVLSALGIEVTGIAEAVGLPDVSGPSDGSDATLSVAGGVAVFAVFLGAGGRFVRHAVAPYVTGVPVGAALLFVAAVIGSETGAHPITVFVTVGLALVALEAGSRSSRLSRRLGPSVDARSAELVHLLGSAVAVAVGIGLATAALYLVVPAAVGLGDARGVVLLLAGLVGLLGAVLLFGRESPTTGRYTGRQNS